jgi:glyoxylase-like metal-dependent hydrolase (beta-lactamase superfamily II)
VTDNRNNLAAIERIRKIAMYRTPFVSLVALCALIPTHLSAATALAPEVHLVRGKFPANSQPDGNSVLLLAPAGVIAVDTGRHSAHAQELIEFARQQHRPIAAVVNTHWHLDHIGGNALLRKTYPRVRIYASNTLRQALQGFLHDYSQQLQQAVAQAKPAADVSAWQRELDLIAAGDQLAPDEPVASSVELHVAGRPMYLHVTRGATAGDIWIEDRAARLVIAGDLVTLPVPFLDTACPEEWQHALGDIAATDFEVLVPGHGAPMTKTQFNTYRFAYAELLACALTGQQADACANGWRERLGKLLAAEDSAAVAPMLDYYFKSRLRSAANRAKYCAAVD